MRHHNKRRTLGRKRAARTALIRSLARSLIREGGITTTVAKAKELRPFIERMISAARTPGASFRPLAARLGNAEQTVRTLTTDIAPRFSSRAGGYTRIVRLGRIGKRTAEMARIEFVQK